MIRRLTVANFRALKSFTMGGLARINLLVGANNGGKTSVLEALHLLLADSPPDAAWTALRRRWEYNDDSTSREVDISHLFHRHAIVDGSSIQVKAETDGAPMDVEMKVCPASDTPPKRRTRFSSGEEPEFGELELRWSQSGKESSAPIPLTTRNGLHADYIDAPDGGRVLFMPVQGLSASALASNYSALMLTPDENRVLEALRTVEPGLERIALTAGSSTRRPMNATDRGGFVALVNNTRIPIGSLGEGIWRALGIAATMVRARGGVLLMDEVDTGLHYSVMGPIWRFIDETARSLDVQVFATTHSRDCVESLATIPRANNNEVSVQRIERDRLEAICLSDEEVRIAAERQIEVR